MGSFATNYEEIAAVLLFVIGMSNLVFPTESAQENYRTRYHGFCCLPFPCSQRLY